MGLRLGGRLTARLELRGEGAAAAAAQVESARQLLEEVLAGALFYAEGDEPAEGAGARGPAPVPTDGALGGEDEWAFVPADGAAAEPEAEAPPEVPGRIRELGKKLPVGDGEARVVAAYRLGAADRRSIERAAAAGREELELLEWTRPHGLKDEVWVCLRDSSGGSFCARRRGRAEGRATDRGVLLRGAVLRGFPSLSEARAYCFGGGHETFPVWL